MVATLLILLFPNGPWLFDMSPPACLHGMHDGVNHISVLLSVAAAGVPRQGI
jgi:hypothetical protein